MVYKEKCSGLGPRKICEYCVHGRVLSPGIGIFLNETYGCEHGSEVCKHFKQQNHSNYLK